MPGAGGLLGMASYRPQAAHIFSSIMGIFDGDLRELFRLCAR